jgi:hypothetical protein
MNQSPSTLVMNPHRTPVTWLILALGIMAITISVMNVKISSKVVTKEHAQNIYTYVDTNTPAQLIDSTVGVSRLKRSNDVPLLANVTVTVANNSSNLQALLNPILRQFNDVALAADNKATPSPNLRLTNSSIFIFVMSRRESSEMRQTIRETWAAGHDNVYFVLGTFLYHNEEQDATIQKEMQTYRDIMLAEDVVDLQENLAAKIKYAYRWAVTNLPNVVWFLKVGDDMYLRVHKLVKKTPSKGPSNKNWFPQAVQNQYVPKFVDPRTDPIMVGGHIFVDHLVPRQGKWAELVEDYPSDIYPPFLKGDGGHMISRYLAEYIVVHSSELFNYQGEDVSLGIWAAESPMDVLIVKDRSMSYSGESCQENKAKYVIGHDFSVETIRKCYDFDRLRSTNSTAIVQRRKELV